MTRTLIGLDYEGLGCVKMTKGNFDPKTTNDSLRERFFFNSKWPNQLTTPEIEVLPHVSIASGNDRIVFTPSGSTVNTFQKMRHDYAFDTIAYSNYYFRGAASWPALRYNMPMMDIAVKKQSNGRYQQVKMTKREFGEEYGSAGVRGGFVGTGNQGSWFAQQVVGWTPTDFTMTYSPEVITSSSDEERSLIVWNLPGNNTPLDGPTTTPSPAGKMAVQITKDFCRAAKPGFDTRTATPQQLAFDSSGRPLSVVAADDIAVPVGTSSYNTGITIPANCYIEISCYDDSSAIFYPMKVSGDNDGYGVEYWPDGTLIRFNNTQKACRARFIVFAVDPTGPSSGTNSVLKQFASGGEVVTQFLRPGAAATPRFSDIILDSRRPVIQILADGYFSVANATTGDMQENNVAFDAAGFFPYIKYMTVHGSGSAQEVRPPRVNRRFQNSLSVGGLAGDGSYCRYGTTGATFYTAKSTPIYTFNSGSTGVTHRYDDNPIVGIRWYALGIPI